MKTADKKMEFIRLRAEGKSYRTIEAEAGISRSTCSEWEKELRGEVARLRQERMEEVYTSYGMAKEARIRRLGETLGRIDSALAEADLTTIAPEKLLDLMLKYASALREEYAPAAYTLTEGTGEETLEAVIDLQNRVATGETTPDQAKTELTLIGKVAGEYSRAHPFSF